MISSRWASIFSRATSPHAACLNSHDEFTEFIVYKKTLGSLRMFQKMSAFHKDLQASYIYLLLEEFSQENLLNLVPY